MQALEVDAIVELLASSVQWPVFVPVKNQPAEHIARLIDVAHDQQACQQIVTLIDVGAISIGEPEPDYLNSDPHFPSGPWVRKCELAHRPERESASG